MKKAPPAHIAGGAGEEKLRNNLERDLQSELRSARAASAEERIADAHVAGGGESEGATALSGRNQLTNLGISKWIPGGNAVAGRVGDEVRQVWIGEIGVIENIEELSPELQNCMLGQVGIFEDREVEFFEGGSAQRVAPEITEMAGPSDAIGVGGSKTVKCAGHGETSQVEEVKGSFSVLDGADDVGSIESFTGSGVVTFKIVIELEGLTVL